MQQKEIKQLTSNKSKTLNNIMHYDSFPPKKHRSSHKSNRESKKEQQIQITTSQQSIKPLDLEEREERERDSPKTVLVGFMATWFLAASPINRSVSVKATYEGVVLLPWSLAMISTRSCCQTPTQEYVVPRSIPIAGPSPFPAIFFRYTQTTWERNKRKKRENKFECSGWQAGRFKGVGLRAFIGLEGRDERSFEGWCKVGSARWGF